MTDGLGPVTLVTLVAPVLVALAFPVAALWLVLSDLRPGDGHRTPPTRTAGVSATAQAVLGLTLGTLTAPWGTVPVALWWLAVWLLSLGVVVLALRWRGLRSTGPRPRRELTGASLWVLLPGAAVLALVRAG